MSPVVNCPFCEEPVSATAIVCKSCQRDISVPRPLMEAKQRLEEKVQSLEDELAEMRDALALVGQQAEAKKYPRIFGGFVLLPIVLLVGLHYLVYYGLDVHKLYLHAGTIIIPILFGYALEIRWRPSWLVMAGAAIVVSTASVFCMNAVVHLFDGPPIAPRNTDEWVATINYTISIAASFIFGSLIAVATRPIRFPNQHYHDGLYTFLAALLAHNVPHPKGEHFEQRVQRYEKVVRLAVAALSGCVMLATRYMGSQHTGHP